MRQWVAVNRNREGVALAVWGPYREKATAEIVAREKGGDRRGVAVEPLSNQYREVSDHYTSLKAMP